MKLHRMRKEHTSRLRWYSRDNVDGALRFHERKVNKIRHVLAVSKIN